MILDICSEPKVLEVMRIVNIFITIIKIVVPILLIFVLILKFAKAVTNDDKDNLQNVLKSAPKNIVAAVIILLIPSLVAIIVRTTFPKNNYDDCLKDISKEEIAILYENKMVDLLNIVERTLDINDYNNASNYLDNIKDTNKYKQYSRRLDEVKVLIDENHRIPENPTIDQSEIVEEARSHIGKNVGLDCSGFVKMVLRKFNYIDDEIAKTSGFCDGRSRGSYGMYKKYLEKGRVVWQRPTDAKNMAESLATFPGDCVPGDMIFYSYGANDCVKHIVFYAGFENGKHMIIDSNMNDNTVKYRSIDGVYRTAYPLACARAIKNGE